MILALIIQIAVFLVWAGLCILIYMDLGRRAQANGTGIGAEFSAWWRNAADRKTRNTALFMTFALILIQLQSSLLGA